MIKRIKEFIKNKTNHKNCEHEYAEFGKVSKYANLNGYRVYIRCEKCGHIKDSYFRYE